MATFVKTVNKSTDFKTVSLNLIYLNRYRLVREWILNKKEFNVQSNSQNELTVIFKGFV